MMPPEVQNDREVVNFVVTRGSKARYVIGVCNGVLTLGAAGLLAYGLVDILRTGVAPETTEYGSIRSVVSPKPGPISSTSPPSATSSRAQGTRF